jgi:hypothetical protein
VSGATPEEIEVARRNLVAHLKAGTAGSPHVLWLDQQTVRDLIEVLESLGDRAEDTAHTFLIAHDAISAIEIGAGSEHFRHGRETMQADALAEIDLFSSHIRTP